MSYHASPAQTCNAPARWFAAQDRERALVYARQAAAAFRVAFCVYAIQAGRPRLLERFSPDEGRDTA